MYNRKRLDSKETVSVRQSFEAHSSSHPEVSRPGDGNRAVRKEIDRKHTAQASPRAKTVKLTDLVDNCGDICRNDPKFGRVFIREMALLLEILHEGDSRLYAMAEKKMRSCEALLAKEAAAETDDEDDEQELLRLLSRRISPGRRGIKLFTGAFAARNIQEPLLSIDVESLASAAFTSDAFSAPVFGVRRKGVVTDYLAREDIGGSDAPRVHTIVPLQVLSHESSLADVIHVLTDFTFCFVSIDGSIVGVIRREDIEKPVVRMWLFGIIILMEIFMV